jgi:hypothetical protein
MFFDYSLFGDMNLITVIDKIMRLSVFWVMYNLCPIHIGSSYNSTFDIHRP